MDKTFMVFTVSVDESRLNEHLRASPDIRDGIVKATAAIVDPPNSVPGIYNHMLEVYRGQSEYAVLVHDDVYLPEGWFEAAAAQVALVEAIDEAWGMIGVCGVWMDDETGTKHFEGNIWDRDVEFKGSHDLPHEVNTLDEVCTIVRNDGETRFDSDLAGHHLWAAEYCLRMRRAGYKNYCIDAYLKHHGNPTRDIHDKQFYFNAGILWGKYGEVRPLVTPCMSLMQSAQGALMER